MLEKLEPQFAMVSALLFDQGVPKTLAKSKMDCLLGHGFRDANQVTDHLANLVVDQTSPLVVFDLPLDLVRPLLANDISDVAWPPFIHE